MDEEKNGGALISYPASPAVEEKIEAQHRIGWSEVDEVFESGPHFELIVAFDQYGEPRYAALGRTAAGRYLHVVFVPGDDNTAKVITAREMTDAERRRYKQT